MNGNFEITRMCYDDYDYTLLRLMFCLFQIDTNSRARTMEISKNVNVLLEQKYFKTSVCKRISLYENTAVSMSTLFSDTRRNCLYLAGINASIRTRTIDATRVKNSFAADAARAICYRRNATRLNVVEGSLVGPRWATVHVDGTKFRQTPTTTRLLAYKTHNM